MACGQSGELFRLTVKKTVIRYHEPANSLFGQLGECRLKIILNPGIKNLNCQA